MYTIKFEEYKNKPIEEKKSIVKSKIDNTSPFWLERLQTAVHNYNPLAVSFSKQLVDEYYKIISNK